MLVAVCGLVITASALAGLTDDAPARSLLETPDGPDSDAAGETTSPQPPGADATPPADGQFGDGTDGGLLEVAGTLATLGTPSVGDLVGIEPTPPDGDSSALEDASFEAGDSVDSPQADPGSADAPTGSPPLGLLGGAFGDALVDSSVAVSDPTAPDGAATVDGSDGDTVEGDGIDSLDGDADAGAHGGDAEVPTSSDADSVDPSETDALEGDGTAATDDRSSPTDGTSAPGDGGAERDGEGETESGAGEGETEGSVGEGAMESGVGEGETEGSAGEGETDGGDDAATDAGEGETDGGDDAATDAGGGETGGDTGLPSALSPAAVAGALAAVLALALAYLFRTRPDLRERLLALPASLYAFALEALVTLSATLERALETASAWLATLPARIRASLVGLLASLRGEASRSDSGGGRASESAHARTPTSPSVTPAEADARERIREAFAAVATRASMTPTGRRVSTPADVAHSAIETGAPAAPVETITAAFRDVEYGARDPTALLERVRAAHESLDRHAPEGDP
ncbi:hypothetical protein GCM10025298_09830 [Natronobiforma cellulositropha]